MAAAASGLGVGAAGSTDVALEDLIGSVDEPPVVKVDDSPEGAGREFLACDYNRDGDSWRSPWSNRFLPEELEDGTRPSQRLRQLEEKAMEAFSTYRQLYYESGISSCYFWDLDDSNFAGAIVIRSQLSAGRVQGSWNSLHVFEATELGVKSVSYKLTSTVMLSFDVKQQQNDKEGSAAVGDGSGNGKEQQKKGNMNLSGSLTRQSEEKLPLPDYASHIANLGKMVEEMEAKQRNLLQTVYFGKTLDVLNSVRSPESLDAKRKERELQKELMGLWKRPGVES
ncbi:f-actin capping protein beta subunit [Ceraceosorus bombacis]|uniref:F-actin-capping protein subunit beta n=1 Tax=Ceraceosorus bombacis TaxID=401625 RepID=A0A0P1B8L8_9BASI|nr:f-actin capping protein beta subunit [Ceraceosorus bombacis]